MNLKPNDFYIGLVEFFAVFLPGIIFLLFIHLVFKEDINKEINLQSNTGVMVMALFISSYLAGNIIFQLASFLDELYDKTKKYLFKDNSRLEKAKEIRKANSAQLPNDKLLNNYEYARACLMQELPATIGIIDRYMADSKFFRSLILLMLISYILCRVKHAEVWIELTCLGLFFFSIYLFFTKRGKATETAYKYLIFLNETGNTDIGIEDDNLEEEVSEYSDESTIQVPFKEDIVKQYIGKDKEYKKLTIQPKSKFEETSPF